MLLLENTYKTLHMKVLISFAQALEGLTMTKTNAHIKSLNQNTKEHWEAKTNPMKKTN